jgi:S-adenosylmethionine-diacylgycerolhomoserine-N-methlytransferase
MTTLAVRRRYARLAPVYDRANLEGLLYARARRRAVELLQLRPGDRVLDVACGTGASFALIQQRIGPAGELVGIDLTPEMLARARARVSRHGWTNVRLLDRDICAPPDDALGAPFDAAICTLGLSVIPGWERAWEAMLALVRPGGRVAVMDAGRPEHRATVERPFAWLLARLFSADNARRPWRRLQRDVDGVSTETFTWGWVTAAGGTKAATSTRRS